MTYYDSSMRLVYTGLDRNARYVLRVTYVGGSTSRLLANGEVLHDYRAPPVTTQVQSFSLATNTTAGGRLVVSCNQPPGLGGTGRTCQIAEIWLGLNTTGAPLASQYSLPATAPEYQ